MDWLQIGALVVALLGLLLAGLVYVTRMLNRLEDRINDRFDAIENRFERIEDRMTRIEERVGRMEQWQARADERFDRVEERLERIETSQSEIRGEAKMLNENVQNLEKEQARMLGFLEGRGVMGKAPPEPEGVA